MKPTNLIKMANQIGAFFEAMPDQAEAARDVAGHIMKSWEPRMRNGFLEHIANVGDSALKPVVREALPFIRNS